MRLLLRRAVYILVFLLFLVLSREAQAVERKKYNVILIVIDALRADSLGCYGYSRNVSPVIDKFSKGGTLFLNAYSQATWTLPSFASILTSRYVFQHKVINDSFKLADSELTLAEILKIFKYQTAAFTAGIHLNRRFNFTQGFDTYEDVLYSTETWPHPEAHISETLPHVIKWLDGHHRDNFFLMLHINDVHPPLHSWLPTQDENMFDPGYKGPVDQLVLDQPVRAKLWGYLLCGEDGACVPLNEKDIAHTKAHYDSSIFYTDGYIGRLLDYLKKKGLMDDTIIILTADHGLDFFEHGTFLSYITVPPFEEVTHIPLIIVHPDPATKGRKITELVQSVDILPTILDFLGIPAKKDAEGLSLAPVSEGKGHLPERFIYSESSDPRAGFVRAEQCKYSLRWGNWKLLAFLVRNDLPFFALYDLSKDPGECHNLFNDIPSSEIRDKLLVELRRCFSIQKSTDFHGKK